MNLNNNWFLISLIGIIFLSACQEEKQKSLPYLGIKDINAKGDTIFHTIPSFSFVDQDSSIITESTFENKVYIADFFYTSCPSICIDMKAQMVRLHDEFLDQEDLVLLSHSIDPEHDTVGVLKAYAQGIDVKTDKWHMVTGDKRAIYEIATKYLVSVGEDPSVAGGFIHDGYFILVDKQKRIRGYYDGTKPEEVDKLIDDLKFLLNGKQGA